MCYYDLATSSSRLSNLSCKLLGYPKLIPKKFTIIPKNFTIIPKKFTIIPSGYYRKWVLVTWVL